MLQREPIEVTTAEETTSEESAAEKSKVASFDRDNLDRGLRNKNSMEILEHHYFILPSELMNASIKAL